MTYLTNNYYDGPEKLRVVIERDYDARTPRLNPANLFNIETWDRVEGTPDFGVVGEKMREVNWSFTGPGNALAVNHRGSHHSYTKLDPRLATIMARWLTAFRGHQYAAPLTRSVDGRLHLATPEAIETVGIVYSKIEGLVLPSWMDWDGEAVYEVNQYNTWARGDVWMYWIEEEYACPCNGRHPGCAGSQWDELPESDSEIYGKDIAASEAMEHLAGLYARKALLA